MPKRYISHSQQTPASQDLPLVERDIRTTFIASVDRVLRNTPDPKVKQSPGVYVGIAGTILMNMHLRALPRELKLGHTHEDLLSFNDAYLASALKLFPTALTKPTSPSRCSFLETPIGLATLVVEHAHDESLPWRAALDLIRGAVHDVLVESSIADDDGCEVLYGRAGLLYALIRLRLLFENASATPVSRAVHDAQITADSTLERIMDSILAHGRYGAKTYAAEVSSAAAPPLMWSWCGKRYLGGAHGVAGILHMLLQCPPHLLSPDACADVWATIAWLLRLQDKDGNWRTKAPTVDAAFDKNELIQWCHGAPGILLLLCRALRHPSASRYTHILPELTHAIDKATSLIYRHGLLRKGLGACHGVAGSVFALLTCARLYLHPPPAWTKGKTPAYASHTRVDSGDLSDGSASPTPRTSPTTPPTATFAAAAHTPLPTPLATLADHPALLSSPLPTPIIGELDDLEAKGRKALYRAVHLAHLVLSPEVFAKMFVPDRPHSLYEGLAGMCCAWAAVLAALRGCGAEEGCWGMPGYDDLML
ncbi:hypothetical protein FB107DRAFT_266034 [Schizophyllum commune]